MEARHADGTREADRSLVAEAPQAQNLPPPVQRYIELVSEVLAVRYIAFGSRGRLLHLWAVTDAYDTGANDAVFSRELRMYEEWPGAGLDFRAVALEGRTLSSAIPSDLEVVWSRSA